jgi:hypothetical protein
VAFGISFLLSLGFWGEHRSILRPSDGIEAPLIRYLRAFSRCAPSGIRQSSRKLLIGAVVELRQSIETELDDPGGREFAAAVARLALDPVDDLIEAPRIDIALVGCADQGAAELLAIERLAMAVALDDFQDLWDGPLIGREAMAARGALTPAPNRVTLRGSPGLEGPGGGVATGTVHFVKCT